MKAWWLARSRLTQIGLGLIGFGVGVVLVSMIVVAVTGSGDDNDAAVTCQLAIKKQLYGDSDFGTATHAERVAVGWNVTGHVRFITAVGTRDEADFQCTVAADGQRAISATLDP